MVERAGFVESPHVDRPLDRVAVSVDIQNRPFAGDRHGAEIDVRRVAPVDGHLRLAGASPLLERRLVQKGKPDRPLDLVDVETREKHDRSVRIDPGHRKEEVMGSPIGEEGEHLALVARHHDGHGTIPARAPREGSNRANRASPLRRFGIGDVAPDRDEAFRAHRDRIDAAADEELHEFRVVDWPGG